MGMFQLRHLHYDDVEWVFDACQDEAIQRWTLVPRPYSFEDAAWFIENQPEYVTMVIEETESSMPLGLVSIHAIDETIWGATARILHELLCVIHGVNHFDLPNW